MTAEEGSEIARHARRLWPQLMDQVLDAAESNPLIFNEHTWGDYAEASLIPNPSPDWHYLTTELASEPEPWRDMISWSPQIERWLELNSCSRMSIDNLVIAVRDLDVEDQVETGLRWIEHQVERSGDKSSNTYTLPEWLRERRANLNSEEQIARWQRVVDNLVVAGDSRVADLAD